MQIQFKSRQRGMSFIGLIFVGGVLAVAGVGRAGLPDLHGVPGDPEGGQQGGKEGTPCPKCAPCLTRRPRIDDITSIKRQGPGGDQGRRQDHRRLPTSAKSIWPGPAYLVYRSSTRAIQIA
jgi:hypothetical protein